MQLGYTTCSSHNVRGSVFLEIPFYRTGLSETVGPARRILPGTLFPLTPLEPAIFAKYERNQLRRYLLNQPIVRPHARSAAALLYRSGVASQLKPCTALG